MDVQKDGDDDVDVAEEEVEADDVQNDKFLRRKMMMLIGTYRDISGHTLSASLCSRHASRLRYFTRSIRPENLDEKCLGPRSQCTLCKPAH